MEGSSTVAAGWKLWLGRTTDLLFPPVCSLCGVGISHIPVQPFLCDGCSLGLTSGSAHFCRGCARPLAIGTSTTETSCPSCRDRKFRFDNAYALGVYEGLLREAVLRMKQASGEALTLAVGCLFGEKLARLLDHRPDRAVAVPTHWSRRLTRVAICPDNLLESVCRRLKLRPSRGWLRCRRRTRKQGTLFPAERRANVRGAYAVPTRYHRHLRGARVLLIDDVMTTGATANEIAKVLKRAGAASVSIGVVARGIGFDG